MQGSIALQLTVSEAFLPVTIVSSLLVVIGVLLFTVNLLIQVNAKNAVTRQGSKHVSG